VLESWYLYGASVTGKLERKGTQSILRRGYERLA
jgi:hypothetical protein